MAHEHPIDHPTPATHHPGYRQPPPRVAALRTRPETVVDDYRRLMHLANYQQFISPEIPTLIKLNLSWTKYFPACSSQPWQVDGVAGTLVGDGYRRDQLIPIENKTVVTEPWKGARNNKWLPVLEKHGLRFQPLTEVEWDVHRFKTPLTVMDRIFPEGVVIPRMFRDKQVIHLPTVKTHGHATTTGAIKNAFGGLLREVRHYCHKHMHEVLVDLVLMQRELHPAMFAVMDGTVCGDGAGPRTMVPRVGNVILASADQVAIDAIAAKIMGFDPMEIPYLRTCHEMGLGVADPRQIEVVGDELPEMDPKFVVKKSLVIWGDQMLRKGPLRFLERVALHSPLVVWAPFASNVYHDLMWYPTIGKRMIRQFEQTPWGELFRDYGTPSGPAVQPRLQPEPR
ncbi:MAG TPA: DUF362 domain-containing protein [Chloroflexota bacterium]|jgi:uncharacterized protein (DUF362 family)